MKQPIFLYGEPRGGRVVKDMIAILFLSLNYSVLICYNDKKLKDGPEMKKPFVITAFLILICAFLFCVSCGTSSNDSTTSTTTTASTSETTTNVTLNDTERRSLKAKIVDELSDYEAITIVDTDHVSISDYGELEKHDFAIIVQKVINIVSSSSESEKIAFVEFETSDYSFVTKDLQSGTFTEKLSDGSSVSKSLTVGELVKECGAEGRPLDKSEQNDFFKDKKRQEKYEELIESYKYNELKKYINKYISENKVFEDDSAYQILDLINPLIKYEDFWSITKDEFDGKTYVSFPETDGITKNQFFDIKLTGTELFIKAGFQKSDWLFFDHILFSKDGEIIYNRKHSTERKVLSGNLIEEFSNTTFDDDLLLDMLKGDKVVIRFRNDDKDENYDHTLTENERKALFCCVSLRITYRDLSDLLFVYNNNN